MLALVTLLLSKLFAAGCVFPPSLFLLCVCHVTCVTLTSEFWCSARDFNIMRATQVQLSLGAHFKSKLEKKKTRIPLCKTQVSAYKKGARPS